MSESQSYIRGILDHVADAVVTIDARGHIESFNPAAVAMFGYAPEEVNGKNVSMLMPEPDRSGHDGYIASYLDTGVGKILGIGAREVTARRKDGGVFPMELTVGVMTVDAKSVFIGAMRDLTRRKKAEAALRRTEDRLHDAIESIPDGFALYDSDDRLVLSNQRYKDLYPRHAGALVPGSRFPDMLRVGVERGEFADAVGREEEWIAERLRLHLDPQGSIEQRLGDGRWLRVEERRTREGGIVGLRTDITALKAAEAAVRESEQRFHDFAESASDWLWETDAELRFTYV